MDARHAGPANSGKVPLGIGSGKWPVIAQVDPQSRGISLTLGHHRNGSVVAIEAFGGKDLGIDQPVDRNQGERGNADQVGKRRGAELHAFPGKPVGLAVERLVLAVLLEQQHREKAGACPSAWHHVERCSRLRQEQASQPCQLLLRQPLR